ncbi:glycosyl transferase family group 2-domain-containing protein [Xylariales sp. AK1849]|nr:glycosyl transferase family group 2-domain-containing protein [Xylariales sp. AK1849]
MPDNNGFATASPLVRQPSAAIVRGVQPQSPRFNNTSSPFEDGDETGRIALMARYLYRRIVESGWIDERQTSLYVPGLVLKDDNSNDYVVEPSNTYNDLKTICSKLDLPVAFTMNCQTSDHVLRKLVPGQTEVTLHPHELTVPVVSSLSELATSDNSVRRRDYICFVRKENVVLVWSQSTDGLLNHASEVEDKLMGAVWGGAMPSRRQTQFSQYSQPLRQQPSYMSGFQSPHLSTYASSMLDQPVAQYADASSMMEKKWDIQVGVKSVDSDQLSALDAEDREALGPSKRPFVLTHSLIAGLSCLILILAQSSQIRQILLEVHALGSLGFNRLAMLATVPIYVFFGLFFFTMLVVNVFQAVGPINDIRTGNTKFYSGTKPDRRKHPDIQWPHITIQMPVYKEGLKGVIQPTINSLLPAIAHYERLGGTASIFVCEDGMQTVSPEIAELRKGYYASHGIGWVARPPHGKDGFIRGGRFKKASNMNYALDFTLRVEDELLRLIHQRRSELNLAEDDPTAQLDLDEEDRLYEQALNANLERDGGKTWAEGNIRMGDIILIIDSDTQVPVDCLSLAAMEMEESPEVAIIQHASGVMQVTHSWFEDAIAYFTDLVYLSIKFAVGNGDVAAFVGHNAFLRWKALQSVRFTDKDGRELFWSESHVSEDFDVALRLQTAGFLIRLATYDKGEFKEGVSLTIFDELLRWEKYAYGCSELLFNPIYQWIYKGPFTPMLWKILTSNIKVSSKFTIFGYVMGTYYAIASALPTALANYFIIGWFQNEIDQIYNESWKIFIGLVAVFQVISPFCFAIYRHRLGNKSFFWAWLEGMKWSLFYIVFFGGISWHVLYALIAHLFCLPIEWASTAKEIEASGFFISLENVLKTYKWVLAFFIPLTGGMIYLGQFAPVDWRISQFYCIIPLAMQVAGHLGLPLLSILS